MNNLVDTENQSSNPVDSTGSLQQVGSQLQAIRTEQKLGLEEVAERLRLAPNIVSAIESGDSGKLPAMTFVRGYIRSYARLLKTDEQSLLAQLGEASSQLTPALTIKRPIGYRSPISLPSGKWLKWVLMLSGLVVLLWFGYPAVERLLSSTGESSAQAPQLQLPQVANQTESVPLSVVKQENVSSNTPVSEPVIEQAELNVETSSLASAEILKGSDKSVEPVELGLYCKVDSWVEVTAEGKKYLAGIMRAGTSEIIRARPPFDILIGNAPSIDIKYNGEPFDTTPFRRGKVARFTLNN